ncbi:hypothetical protein G1C96_1755 [Bifidobacterium sp. DSM 109958]|uniref:Uncharacterized protein n=2 Tax=Bifidobacterium moraviense TaxID=2675323 RepID=A0A7Y0F352_9BIFI|nr:hypothetical protein [Bifidobacterium sp. DSM 109958]
MGFLDQLRTMFAGHSGTGRVRIGGPLAVPDAKRALTHVLVQQPLLGMRPVAEALRDLQRETPWLVTYGMDHYFNSPKLVRFQNSGGKQLDVDAIATLHAQPGPLADEVTIQHLLDDIEDRRGHASADAQIGHISVTPVARRTAEVLGGAKAGAAADDAAVRDWLFALLDQIGVIDEVTGGDLKPLADALKPAIGEAEVSAAGLRGAVADALGIADAGLRAALIDQTTATDAYLAAVEILSRHGIEVPETVELA